MKKIFKGKVATVIVIIITVILAGVAIFTAIRLYQLRQTSVSPTAPESKPGAAGVACGGIAGTTCPSGEQCVYSDGTTRAPFPDAQGTCQPGGTSKTGGACSLSFSLTTPTGSPTPTPTPTPTPAPECNSSCTTDNDCPTNYVCAPEGTGGAKVCRNAACTKESSCACPTASPTPTPTASPTPTPTTPPTTPPTSPPECNASCTTNSQCPSDMICYIAAGATNGNCRNPSCQTDSDCVCNVAQTTTPPTSQPSLPASGTSWPTITGIGIGILVLLGSILLAI